VRPERNPADGARASEVIRAYAVANSISIEEPRPGVFVLVLPGERKQQTTVLLALDPLAVAINAFVVRKPDENAEAVYRWLLERNGAIYAVAYSLDHLGDIYLTGRVPLRHFDEAELDAILGSVLENSDGAFNQLLELGFASAIRREWEWRISRGESTRNLAAFSHLAHTPESFLRQDGPS